MKGRSVQLGEMVFHKKLVKLFTLYGSNVYISLH